MATEMTKGGVSTTKQAGQFAYEKYKSAFSNQWIVQWDYRDASGVLHSGIAKSLADAQKSAARYGYTPVPM